MPIDTTPLPPQTTLTGKVVALVGIAVSCAYLANIGAGIFGEIPDVIPGIGNLDEAFFSGLLFVCLAKLGINVIPGLGSNRDSRIVQQ